MKKHPNIVFVLADDQGAWSLGSAGNPEIITPHLDRMAQEGLRFENFFCTSPVCSPARASILTGMMPSGHGVLDWLRSGGVDKEKYGVGELEKRYVDEEKPIRYLEGFHTYPEVLAENGYICGLSGKWHLGDHVHPAPGFSNWYTIGMGGCPYFSPDIVQDGKITIENAYITDLITEQALQQLNIFAQQEAPFYLSVHYTAPHCPWDKDSHPKEYVDLYADCPFTYTPDLPIHPNQTNSSTVADTPEKRREYLAGYYAAITAMDVGIGKILEKLEQLGVAEDTLVVFTSDNGVCMGHHGVWGKGNATYPQNMYEESVKIPCIMWKKGMQVDTQIPTGLYSHYDLYTTLLDFAGITAYPVNTHTPGRSFVNLLQGEPEQPDRDHIFIFEEYGAVRMVRSKQYKYVHRYPVGEQELYDLFADPHEAVNLAHHPDYQELVAQMQKHLFDGFGAFTIPEHNGLLYPVMGKGQKRKLNGIPQGTFFEETGLLRER